MNNGHIHILKDDVKKNIGVQLVCTKIFTKVQLKNERAPELSNWLQVRND